ncbi:START domain-containing protein [Aureivirga sp. CE67]|uniref:START domain-containing protein n=1 Tax=Aureivirga sp. CE67 TaxID=1788983 RepID=UPI0018C9AB88|nr:START domain-containing protein [Aureivirga sp. CE67]
MKNLFMIILCICFTTVNAQKRELDSFTDLEQFTELASKSEWKIAKKRKGIVLKYRKLKFSDTLEVREMKAEFSVFGSLNKMYEVLKSPKKIEQWNENVKDMKILQDMDSTWISHYMYKIPHLFTQQDLVIEHVAKKKGNGFVITAFAKPKYIPDVKDFRREKFYLSEWRVMPAMSGQLSVEFSVVSISDSKIPRFIKDPIIQNKLIDSFLNLQKLMKSE